MLRTLLIMLIITFLPAIPMEGKKRTANTVKQEKREVNRRIEQTRGKIKSNLEQTRRQLAQYESLGAEISMADRSIATLSHKVDSVTTREKALADSVELSRKRVETLKESYAESLRSIRRQRQLSSATTFIFSSRSFSEARKRMRYLRELGNWQTEKATDLHKAVKILEVRQAELDSMRRTLAASLSELKIQKSKLVKARNESDALVSQLRKQGRQLNQALSEQQARTKRLDDELNRIIEEEARAAAEAEKQRRLAAEKAAKAEEAAQKARDAQTAQANQNKPTDGKVKSSTKDKGGKQTPAKTPPSTTKPSPATTAPQKQPKEIANVPATPQKPAAKTFEQAKGRLPMPVSGPAVIVSDFGRHTHEAFSKVEVQNNGIDIETSPGASAVAVYPGTVSMVIVMDGFHNVVLVRHGEYLTVYAGITDLAVHKGQQVTAGQPLGRIYSDPADGNRTRLHFEVRREKEKLNPSLWLR